ncbi:MAG: vitamin B12-dependent ribonucleotide reductase [Candidatus Aenigmarchaeota archaeon]|nr:vitamin B12-dependent ribonucleotide reductase [Candidatus Aenigmarchaeota archaeon]
MSAITQIKKRDGRIADFDQKKITEAVFKAASSVGGRNYKLAEELSDKVIEVLEKQMKPGEIPDVEFVQDTVEKVLIESSHAKTAKAYILYRQKRADIREAKALLGVTDELKLSMNAIKVLSSRYLKKNENRKIIETTGQLVRRVAKAVAEVEKKYGKDDEYVKKLEDEFYEMIASLEFLPNSPTLMNAGTELGQLSACFVLPVEDDMRSIFEAVKNTALVHQTGGGTGFSFSRLRPKGDVVKSTGGVASGPISFMQVFNAATEVIKQGGKRRGANMGIMRIDHPDILEFITCKEREGTLANFNISVAITEKFMQAVEKNGEYDLVNPRTKEPTKRLPARAVFNLLIMMAWKNGEPGIIFIDEINRKNPTPQIGAIESTNPCGEQPLLPYESCNLGSINLTKMLKDRKIDWDKLKTTVRTAVRFLDNVVDANKYPIDEIGEMTRANRKIGLGVMGLADFLIQLGISYASEEAIKTAEELMKFIDDESKKMSEELGIEKGSFKNFRGSALEKKYNAMRNATTTTIAPTGTLSVIADCSSGIEPIFAVSYIRDVSESLGHQLIEVNPFFERMAIERDIYNEEMMKAIAKRGSIQKIPEIPEDIRKLFVTALDIQSEWHVRMQAAFQKYTDNAVSKTINFPNYATPHDVEKAFMLAWKLKCKGLTVYRYGSRDVQVLNIENGGASAVPDQSQYNYCPTCSL